ncbi:unnamed protein product [Linum tenue]|uniref:S-protein homolog n=1 Tax=Linum tenue TaxID=586396 RepID=A0AAV0IEX4_9ROSI|nr:unnamed protein product [Linum tenue]
MIIIVVAQHSTHQTKPTVQVINQLSSKVLIVHCASKDDDLGAHAVEINVAFQWSFNTIQVGGATLFWCNVAVEDKRLSFVAYDQGLKNSFNYPYWLVRDDGRYGQVGTFQLFVRAWKRT